MTYMIMFSNVIFEEQTDDYKVYHVSHIILNISTLEEAKNFRTYISEVRLPLLENFGEHLSISSLSYVQSN